MTRIEFTDILSVDEALKEKVRVWRNREEVNKFFINRHFITPEEHCGWIEGLQQKDDEKFWIVFYDHVPIGSVYLQNVNIESKSSEWGFYIGEKEYRGRGLSGCIIYQLLEYFFDTMGFEVLITKVLSENVTAVKIYNKFGFSKESEDAIGNKNVIFLRFSREEWFAHKEVLRIGNL